MLCSGSEEKKTVRAISKQIDKDLRNARRKLRTEKKLLLLGWFTYLSHLLNVHHSSPSRFDFTLHISYILLNRNYNI